MKIIYVAETRMPSGMAQGLQVIKMCEAFAKQGIDLELVIPRRFHIFPAEKESPFSYYKVEKIFKIKRVFCFDLTPLNRFLGPVSFLIQIISFSVFSAIYLMFKKADIIYGRDRFSLFFLSFFRKNIVFEIHKIHKFLFKRVLKKARKLIVITDGLKKALIDKGISANKIVLAPDGIDLDDFRLKESKVECRKILNLPINKKLVLYAGHLYKWKGVETLALASKFLLDDVLIVIVGGIKWYLSDFKKFVKENKLKNILILGHKDYAQIPYFLKSADCLVLTGTQDSETSKSHTSPMKMFEYMVSNKPMVASDLPSFREVLNESNSLLVKTDNPEAMAQGIKKLLDDVDLSKRISDKAYTDVQKHTWDNRAIKILESI